MDTLKSTRKSYDGLTEYQIEYTLRGRNSQYRMRRGNYGSYTHWYKTDDIGDFLYNCGFNTVKPVSLLEDFYVESHFGKGIIKLTTKMAQDFAQAALQMNAVSRHVYSRMKQVGGNEWCLPATVIENDEHFSYIYKTIKKNL